ncbi:MAG: hypothetical protein E6R03_12525 [Hyphomicrobiaceae bacterium]|nr:MAG: hypothetical protein E6R03_12525 [Hyphomicrobiaceae bacterium]
MKVVYCDLMVNGEIHMQVPDKLVTIPELAILRHIHGAGSIYNVRPTPKTLTRTVRDPVSGEETLKEVPWAPMNDSEKAMVKADQNAERDRLRKTYGRNRSTQILIADEVFPGAVVRLPDTLDEIGMSPVQMADDMRKKAQALMDAADAMEAGEETKKSGKKEAA